MKNPNYDYVHSIVIAMCNVLGDDKIAKLQSHMATINPKLANDEHFEGWLADKAVEGIANLIPE